MNTLIKLALLAAAATTYALPVTDSYGTPTPALKATNAMTKYPCAAVLGKGVEGASVDKSGEIYAANGKNLYKLSQSAKSATPYASGGTSYASSRFTHSGVLVGDASNQTVYTFSGAGAAPKNLFPPVKGMLQPNDMAISACESRIYMSGMNYTANTGDLWYYNTKTKEAKTVPLTGTYRLNGIELSPDDKTLYFTSAQNTADGKGVEGAQVYQLSIGSDGMPTGTPKVAIDLFKTLSSKGLDAKTAGMDPDGMRMDKEGTLFMTLNAFQKVLKWNTKAAPETAQVIDLETVKFPSNLELGGKDGKTLVVIGRCAANETDSCVDSYKHTVPGRAYFNLNKPVAPVAGGDGKDKPATPSAGGGGKDKPTAPSSPATTSPAAVKPVVTSTPAPAPTGGQEGAYKSSGDNGMYRPGPHGY